MPRMSERTAQVLVEAFNVNETLNNDEEAGLLQKQNPELLQALHVLREIANESVYDE